MLTRPNRLRCETADDAALARLLGHMESGEVDRQDAAFFDSLALPRRPRALQDAYARLGGLRVDIFWTNARGLEHAVGRAVVSAAAAGQHLACVPAVQLRARPGCAALRKAREGGEMGQLPCANFMAPGVPSTLSLNGGGYPSLASALAMVNGSRLHPVAALYLPGRGRRAACPPPTWSPSSASAASGGCPTWIRRGCRSCRSRGSPASWAAAARA